MKFNSRSFTNEPYSITKARKSQEALLSNGEYCSLRRDVAATVGRYVGEQIRVSPTDEGRSAAFTIKELHDDDAAIRVAKSGRERLETSPGAEVTLLPTVPKTSLSRMEAFEKSDVTETVWDTGQDKTLLCAPHDGCESNTARMAGIVRKRVGPEQASAWFVHNFGQDGFDRWHIASHRMSPSSYPGLARVSDRGFDCCISFHVWNGSEVLIGGLADAALREQLGRRIAEAIDNKREIITDYTDMKYAGNTMQNVVNWQTDDGESGIQIELTPVLARQYRKRVARAVADWVDDRL